MPFCKRENLSLEENRKAGSPLSGKGNQESSCDWSGSMGLYKVVLFANADVTYI